MTHIDPRRRTYLVWDCVSFRFRLCGQIDIIDARRAWLTFIRGSVRDADAKCLWCSSTPVLDPHAYSYHFVLVNLYWFNEARVVRGVNSTHCVGSKLRSWCKVAADPTANRSELVTSWIRVLCWKNRPDHQPIYKDSTGIVA